jgi:hypothetical protein
MSKLNRIFSAALIIISLHAHAGYCPALSGTYTIGKNEGADFSSVSEAVNAARCGGITGPVTFIIETGTYNERVVIFSIPGSSAFNTITFQSKTGNNADVVISYASSDATLIIIGTSNISFENISVSHRAATYGNAVRIEGNMTHTNFHGVIFDGVEVARTGANSAVIYFTPSARKTDIAFENCEINYGSIGIVKTGMDTRNPDTKTSITGTIFFNQFETALALSNESAPVIRNNVINSLSNFSNFKGISLNNVSDNLTISNNIITMATGSTGIEMNNCVARADNFGQVTANTLSVGGKDEASGIVLTGNTDNQVLNFNRVKLTNGIETANQAYYRNSGTGNNINMVNNIFFDLSTGQYTIIGNTYKDVFNQLPAQSNSALTVSANGLMIEKTTPVK